MSKRLISALLGAMIAVFASSGAEARVENNGAAIHNGNNGGSLTRANMGKNFKARPSARYAYSKSGKRYTVRGTKTSKRYARSNARSRGSRHANHSGHGGGTSRSCLTSEARSLLGRIEANFGSVEIVSTCRPGAVIAGSGKPSKHRYGQAIDFSAGGRKAAIVNWLIANHHSGGTMTYAGMNHIHVDIGYRFVKLNHGGGRSRRA